MEKMLNKENKNILTILIAAAICILAFSGYFILGKTAPEDQQTDGAFILTSLCGVNLADTKETIISRFGKPMKKEDYPDEKKESWSYILQRGSDKDMVVIKFKRDKIKAVLCHDDEVEGVKAGSELKDALARFGEPSYISTSPSNKMLIYNFSRYNLILSALDGKIRGVGMLSPEFDPLRFMDDPKR